MSKKKAAVIMGSDSDWPVVEKAVKQLRELGIEVEARVMSAHRTPEQAREFSVNARANGFGVIIAAAGKAAHLGHRREHHPSSDRHTHQEQHTRRARRPPEHRADALRHPRRHRRH